MIGQTVSHYRIVAKLGEGGMGEVFLADDTELGRRVALKFLPRGVTSDPAVLDRFRREARAAAALSHSNIVTIHEIGTHDGQPFIVMTYVEGKSLREAIDEDDVPLDRVLDIVIQIAEGLAAAHAAGVIHRDIKPDNIILDGEGKPLILDFGLAKLHGATVLTQEQSTLGTIYYMSPEQTRGADVDARSDIFSLGVLAYELIAGQRPFRGDHREAVLYAITSVSPQPLGRYNHDATDELERIVTKMLAKDPSERYQTARDVIVDLKSVRSKAAGDVAAPRFVDMLRAAGRMIRPALPWMAAAVAIIAAFFAGRSMTGESAPTTIARFSPRSFGDQAIFNARFLPDNDGIVYSSAPFGNVPYLEYLPSGAVAPRRIGPAGATLLSVSREGELAVLTDTKYQSHRVFIGTLARMTIDGSPRPLTEKVHDADWGPNGELAIVRRVGGTDRLEYPIGNVLYETSGYVSDPRVSPEGNQVAFNDHEWWNDDRGSLLLVDANRKVRQLSDEYWAIEGLVWTHDASTILFAASPDASDLQPMAVRVSDGGVRPFFGVSTSTTIVDIDAQDRRLVLSGSENHGVMVHPVGSSEDLDLTWLDSCWNAVLADEETLVFTDGRGGSNYSVAMRKIDGSPIVTLGPGDLKSISPDGARVVAQIATPPGTVIYTTGAGTARHLDPGAIVQFQNAFWFPDSEHILVVGNEAGGPTRCYRQAVSGGAPEPVPIPGAGGVSLLTLDGLAVLAQDKDQSWFLYPLDGGAPRALPGMHSDDEVWAWNPDGTAIYVSEQRQVPLAVFKVDLATQERRLEEAIGSDREPGLTGIAIAGSVFDPADSYAYSYVRQRSQLFVVEGTRW